MKTILIHITSKVKINDFFNNLKSIDHKSIKLRYIAHKSCLQDTELKKFKNKIHYKYNDIQYYLFEKAISCDVNLSVFTDEQKLVYVF